MKKIKLEDHKNIICSNKMILLDNPSVVSFSLENYAYLPTVKKGDYVYQEEQIAFRKKDHFPVFSSVSGIVSTINPNQIIIQNDFKNRVRKHNMIEYQLNSYTKEEISNLLFELGVVSSMATEMEPYQTLHIPLYKTLIIHALQQESYFYLESFLLKMERKQILELIEAMIEIYNFKEVFIVIPKQQDLLFEEWKQCVKDNKIKLLEMEEYYSLSSPKELVRTVKKIIFKKDPTEKGIVLWNVSTVIAIYRALKYQRPQIKTIVQFTGNMWKDNCYMEVRIGTPLKEAVQKLSFKRAKEVLLLNGGVIGGKVIDMEQTIITPKLPLYTAWKVTSVAKQESCIRCGKCIKACPMHLHPVLIIDAISKKKKLDRFDLEYCIECGLCSYVCPSNIQVDEIIKSAKEMQL